MHLGLAGERAERGTCIPRMGVYVPNMCRGTGIDHG